ncbi:M28 family peptidase [Leptolyngbya sp. 7M]|uniref:M28 family peptidase n=1 Tax=Leptolyngbya sp. 7M TaxID=2812896 RepID=UPI001B8BFBE9|nr:M28 family peptidase [Leptolyngbya sp. 7M]QYO65218.1 M28 family peptidase [Leptolyngbya sp. 7M]
MVRYLRTKGSLGLILLAVVAVVPAQLVTGKRVETVWKPASKYFDAVKLLDDVRQLSSDDMEGRSADRPSMQKARDLVERRFKESGVQPIGGSYKQEFQINRRNAAPLKGINFVGKIEGKDRKKRGKYIVITAHYDHVGVSDGEIYNGADDNASGTAALFAIAAYFKKNQPQHSLIFVALDAEEKGLQGARYFVSNLPFPKESILLNVNMDMLSRNEKGELYAAGTYHYPQFKPALEKVQRNAKVKLLLGHDDPKLGRDDWTNQSDHAAFHAAKIPFIYFGVEDHKDYHRPTDTFENIQPEFYVKAVETIISTIRGLDTHRVNK